MYGVRSCQFQLEAEKVQKERDRWKKRKEVVRLMNVGVSESVSMSVVVQKMLDIQYHGDDPGPLRYWDRQKQTNEWPNPIDWEKANMDKSSTAGAEVLLSRMDGVLSQHDRYHHLRSRLGACWVVHSNSAAQRRIAGAGAPSREPWKLFKRPEGRLFQG
ncbi:hypothetical protein HYFRA_00009315 [Hymenoscyphus fraxineus]|uniref:Uncharacterized protein n=1 Tax=Hymenoscyphus fraxineus TaxID=746836 RepID=A0A9N9L0Y8_9HELO|nr:hypothetical protein HYFRA_00009315 [Hymenoscyphus fraxineus]